MSRARWFVRAVPVVLALGTVLPVGAAAQGVEEPRIPLRTAMMELNTLRTEYAEAHNRKDGAAIAAVYAPDAIFIDVDGRKYTGDGVRAFLEERASAGGHMVLASDTVRVYGSTAVDVGTVTLHPAEGGELKARYTTVSRRGMSGWRIVSVAVVPLPAE